MSCPEMHCSYRILRRKWDLLFEAFNPTFPKSIFAPGFAEAWQEALEEAGWASNDDFEMLDWAHRCNDRCTPRRNAIDEVLSQEYPAQGVGPLQELCNVVIAARRKT